jgi:molybdenum cofactor synthesis domain-containing protein
MHMKPTITAAIIVIGNEILSGRTQDLNIQFLAKELAYIGIRLMEVRIIPDIHEHIIQTINTVRPLFTYIFTTGGIGPTHDDITSNAIAAAFNVPLSRRADAVQRLKNYYKDSELNEARLKMAEVPEGAILIDNPISSAPGYYIGNVYVMAGIPNIMQAMFQALKPTLVGGSITHSKELTAYVSESSIAAELTAIQNQFPEVEMGSYPFRKADTYGTNIVLRSTNTTELAKAYNALETLLSQRH